MFLYIIIEIIATGYMCIITTTLVIYLLLALAFPVSRPDNSLHVVFSLVSGITPDLQVDRRKSIVEIYPPTYVTPYVLIIMV